MALFRSPSSSPPSLPLLFILLLPSSLFLLLFSLLSHLAFVNLPMYLLFYFLVKIWSTNMQRSTGTIESKANICCVKWNPSLPYLLAFGSAGGLCCLLFVVFVMSVLLGALREFLFLFISITRLSLFDCAGCHWPCCVTLSLVLLFVFVAMLLLFISKAGWV